MYANRLIFAQQKYAAHTVAEQQPICCEISGVYRHKLPQQ
jgi:hypothetical protein